MLEALIAATSVIVAVPIVELYYQRWKRRQRSRLEVRARRKRRRTRRGRKT